MPEGKPSTKAKNKYNAKAYDSLRIVVPKGQKTVIADYAERDGKSVNSYVKTAIKAKIKADTGDEIEL